MVQTRSQTARSGQARRPKKSKSRPKKPLIGSKRPRSRSRPPRSTPASHLPAPRPTPTSSSSRPTPDWLTLPDFLWTEIFLLAAADLKHGGIGKGSSSLAWLASTLRICVRLYPAAMRALYRHLEPNSPARATAMAAVIRRDPELNYGHLRPAAMVRSFRVEIRTLRVGEAFFDDLPSLRHLEFYSLADDSMSSLYGPLRKYDESLFDGSKNDFRLRSFVWNSRLLPRGWSHGRVREIHQTSRFRYLEKVTFRNYPYVPPASFTSDPAVQQWAEEHLRQITMSLEPLQYLRHVAFEKSAAVDDKLLSMLPTNLTRLDIHSCMNVESRGLAAYLSAGGTALTHLTLFHNESLDLHFLIELGRWCPRLQELRGNPFCCDTFLDWDDEKGPSWPASLTILDLENIRGRCWYVAKAEEFLQSLIDNVRGLPMLRHLVIRMQLDVPWRQRAEFREIWHHKLGQVFLRPASPAPGCGSGNEEEEPAAAPSKTRKKRLSTPTRASGRIAARRRPDPLPSSRASSSSISFRKLKTMSYEEPDSDEFDYYGHYDESDSGNDSGSDSGGGGGNGNNKQGTDTGSSLSPASSNPRSPDNMPDNSEPLIQGLCTTVSLVCDNQTPAERQYGMDDFLDEETDDDSDEWYGFGIDFGDSDE